MAAMQRADKTSAPATDRAAPSSQAGVAQRRRGGADLPQRHGSAAGYTSQLPATLLAGVQRLSGLRLDRVQVHHNARQPAAIGALAYAQGQHIYLGPGQDQHLAHEAWHVVQQAQGRVPASQQLKAGPSVNTDHVLEREADAMGARAQDPVNTSAAVAQTERSTERPASLGAQVVQRRLAPVTAKQAAAQPEMLREMLLLGLRHLSEPEQTELVRALNDAAVKVWTLDAVAENIRVCGAAHLSTWHRWLQKYTPQAKRYVSALGQPKSVAATPEQTVAVLGHVKVQVLPALKALLGHTKLQQAIFGPEADLKHVNKVLLLVLDAMERHVAKASSPMVGQGNAEHALWVGVGGITSFGSPTVELSLSNFDAAVRGELNGLATLVHEFTHAAGNTLDVAYDSDGMAKLTSAERVVNAETYAQAFLEMHSPDPKRYYDPLRIVDTHKASSAKSPALLKQRIGGVKKLMTELWQAVDNVYGMVPLAFDGKNTPLDVAKVQSMIWLATYPHRPALRLAGDMAMALLEDRTRVLKVFKDKPSTVNAELKAQGVNKARMESPLVDPEAEFEALCALALMRPFNLSGGQARTLVHQLLRLKAHLTLALETYHPDSQPGMVIGMTALADLLDVESDHATGASPVDARYQLGDMIKRYGLTDYRRADVTGVLAAYMRAIRATLPSYV